MVIAKFLRSGDDYNRPAGVSDVVEKDGGRQRMRSRHFIFALPVYEVPMPLPDITDQRPLCIDLELMRVYVVTQQPLRGRQQRTTSPPRDVGGEGA